LLGGSLGLGLWPSRVIALPTRALHVLDAKAFQVLVAIASRVVPMPDADPVAIAHAVDEALVRVPSEAQVDINRLLKVFENALPGLILDGRTAPFTRLPSTAQDRVLERWRDSRLVMRRGGYHALRKLCLGAYYGDSKTWKRIQYPGPPDTAGFDFDDSKAGTPAWLTAEAARQKTDGGAAP